MSKVIRAMKKVYWKGRKKIKNKEENSEQDFVELFLAAKRIEGCSEKSLKYYKATIETMLDELKKDVKHIVTDDIRGYLTEYQEKKKSSRVTIDNIRRILSSFFSWLEDEDYILKSPVRRIPVSYTHLTLPTKLEV